MLLSMLPKGVVAEIHSISHPQEDMQRQLLALGFDPGETVQLMTRAPFGHALQVKVGATLVAIHSDDASHILLRD